MSILVREKPYVSLQAVSHYLVDCRMLAYALFCKGGVHCWILLMMRNNYGCFPLSSKFFLIHLHIPFCSFSSNDYTLCQAIDLFFCLLSVYLALPPPSTSSSAYSENGGDSYFKKKGKARCKKEKGGCTLSFTKEKMHPIPSKFLTKWLCTSFGLGCLH